MLKRISVILLLVFVFSCSSDDSSMEETITTTVATIIEVTNVSENSATISGTAQAVQGSSISAKGIVWGANSNPTVEGDFSTNEGTTSGDFTSTITSLTDDTEYHLRAYITTDVATFYSTDQTFTTLSLCNGGNVYNGDAVLLDTQAQVEAFGALGYCEINAYIRIGTIAVDVDKITDISPLSTIKKVKGFTINNTLLFNVDSLQNLVATGVVSFFNNENLVNIDGLSNITSPLERIRISNNPMIVNIDGLINITQITIGDIIGISIVGNDSLENIDGLANISNLENWSGGSIEIRSNSSLLNFDGLQSIESLDNIDLVLIGSDFIQNIDALQNITSAVGSNITIAGLSIEDISGLSNINSTVSSLEINFTKLTNLTAISGIPSVETLSIYNNEFLTNLQGLLDLDISFELSIQSNDSLMNLDGLGGITSNIENILIFQNELLTDFCSLTVPLSANPVKNYSVYDNAYNPTQQDIIDGNCSQ